MNTARTLIAGLALALAPMAVAQQIQINVNGELVPFADQQPVMMADHVMVPIRDVFERMGSKVHWNPYTSGVTIENGTTQIRLFAYDRLAYVGDKEVFMDLAPLMVNNRVVVPIRFVSEALGASVNWDASAMLVSIQTGITAAEASKMPIERKTSEMNAVLPEGTVIPMKLETALNSSTTALHQAVTATLDTKESADYAGLPKGTAILGHVMNVRPMSIGAPGILELLFDRVQTPDGASYPINAAPISLDDKAISTMNGRMFSSAMVSKDVKYVGYGDGTAALLALAVQDNLYTDTTIYSALLKLFGEGQFDVAKYHEVNMAQGTPLGIRLNSDFNFRSPTAP